MRENALKRTPPGWGVSQTNKPSFGGKEVAEKWLRDPKELQNKAAILLETKDIPGSVSQTNLPLVYAGR